MYEFNCNCNELQIQACNSGGRSSRACVDLLNSVSV